MSQTMPKILKYLAIAVAVGVVALGGRYLMLGGGSEQAAAIGGPFELVNGQGETVTDQDFRGTYMLIYFGYTYCPDVCPTALQTVARAMQMIPEDAAEKVTPVFISVDPDRDSPEHVGRYVDAFHDRMVGLTGSPEQVKAAADAYKVYYAKVDQEGADDDTYLMDHSSIVYLMGPDGTFVTHFSHGTTAEDMAARLSDIL